MFQKKIPHQASEAPGIPCMFRHSALLSSILRLCDISFERSLQQVQADISKIVQDERTTGCDAAAAAKP
jgi:hypothetical protein